MLSRRALIRSAAAATLLAGVGLPEVSRGGAGVIRVGHLRPRSGPFGPLGDYAVMGIWLAAEEINAAGGVNGRRIELLLEDSADPQLAPTKAERLVRFDKVALLIGDAERNASPLRFAGHRGDEMPAVFVAAFRRRYGKPPQAPSWVDYRALRVAARSIGIASVIVPPTNAHVR